MRRNGRARVEVRLDGRAHLLEGRTFGADRIVVVRDISVERARGADVRDVPRLAAMGTRSGTSRRSTGVENVDVEPASMSRRRSPGEVPTVLLVDGDDVVRQALRLVLEDSGYRVLDAEDGERALDVARRFDGPIHLLVTEVALPRMMGRELARRLASTRAVKVLFTSGDTERTLRRCGFAPGAPELLRKAFSPSALRGRVREMLAPTASTRQSRAVESALQVA
jgi:CheY-like chemotaxis protein